MIQVDLITGFLGAGKTTFIKEYARFLLEQGMKIGILENDYGAVNVDAILLGELRGDNCEIEMIAGGCDFDCHKRRFKTKLISMAMMGYQRVIVEPSGIFDVDEFFDLLYEEPLDNWYEIGNVITIVDAGLRRDLSRESEYLLACQVAKAGKVVFSRWVENGVNALAGTVAHLNSALEACRANRRFSFSVDEQGKLCLGKDLLYRKWDELSKEEWKELISSGYQNKDHIKQRVSEENQYTSLYFMNVRMSYDKLRQQIEKLVQDTVCGHVFRIKGFMLLEEGNWLEINANEKGIEMKTVEKGQEVIIVIGEDLQEDLIRNYWA